MNQTIDTLFQLYEYAEVSEVTNLSSMLAANRILHLDSLPRIFLQLLDAQRHLALVTVECDDDSLNLVANLRNS